MWQAESTGLFHFDDPAALILHASKNTLRIPRSFILCSPDNQNLPPIPLMSQHRSLKSGGGTVAVKRSVLKRGERIKLMKARGQWKDGRSPYGLPKTRPAD